MIMQLYPCDLVMLQVPLRNPTTVNSIVIIAEGKGTQRMHVLNVMVFHLGGIKGDSGQGEFRQQVNGKQTMSHLCKTH
jgi:hypothetical protein